MIGVEPNDYIDDPFPDGFLPKSGNTLGLMTNVGANPATVWADTKIPMMHEWNFNIQYQLPGNVSVEAAYAGSRSLRIDNGAINMSILDGWWHEAYNSDIGWAIGREEDYDDEGYQDMVESNAIYEMLEQEVIPLFYNRGADHLPRGWIALMKASMAAICPEFNTHRMVHEYIKQAYHPCVAHWESLTANNFAKVRELTSWKVRIRQHWSGIRIGKVEMDEMSEVKVGEHVTIKAQVHLGSLTPEDVAVEAYQGQVDPQGNLVNALSISMSCLESHEEGNHTFMAAIPCRFSGLYGYSVRILPKHHDLTSPYEMGLILWAP